MLGASLYITACSTRNRWRVRLRRLREPRYLVGAIVGSAYLYFSMFARGQGRRAAAAGRGRPPFELAAAWQVAGTSIAGLVVFVMAATAWVLPGRSRILAFSRAETAFLFPAPVSRRQLLLHRVLRSQVGSLVVAVIMAVLFGPASGLGRVTFALGMWTLFVTARVYFAAVALTRAGLLSPEPSLRRRAWALVSLWVAALSVVLGAVARQFVSQPPRSVADLAVRLARVASAGLPSLILWPFTAVLRPQLASGLSTFAGAMAGSLAVLVATAAWMLSNDDAFDLAAGEGAEQQTTDTRTRISAPRARDLGWTIGLTGRPEEVFVWKNAMQTFRVSNGSVLRWLGPLLGAFVGLTSGVLALAGLRGPAGFLCALSLAVAGFSVLFGPQMMRLDLRADLENLDLLKTWPVRSAAVVRGEMLWPASFVTACAWLAIVCAAIFSGTAFPSVPFTSRWALAASATLAAPALVAAQYTVHNAAALFFPAWVPLDVQRTRGIDAVGQRLIMLAGIFLSLMLFALPGALAGGLVWFVFRPFLGTAVFVPAAALFAAVVLVEVLAATELLGPAYERLDVMSVERSE